VPSVSGVSLYLIPETGITKTQLSDGYKLTDIIQCALLKRYNVNGAKSFMYVESETQEDLSMIKSLLQKRTKEWDSDHVKDLSSNKKELKLRADPLTAKLLGDIL
jgi:hypothetical protein